jgi:hypothetical protein
VNWVLDVDIKSLFDRIDHGWMLRFSEHRIADRRMLRLIRKWLNAGVIENGDVIVVRYADDSVVGFEDPEDARRLLLACEPVWASSVLCLMKRRPEFWSSDAMQSNAARAVASVARRPSTFSASRTSAGCAERIEASSCGG